MKAAVCYEPGKPLRIEEIDIDPPHAGEVKVRLVATAICHSDIHALHGDWNGNFPVVVGHEAAGVVEEIGENVTLTAPGDNVVVSLLRTCGHCFYCAQGLSNLCNGTFALQTESRLHNKRGDPIYQGIRTAAFAEYVIVDQSQIVQVQQTIPLEKAALLACGVITGVGSVVNTGQVKPGSSVVVIGLGGVGVIATRYRVTLWLQQPQHQGLLTRAPSLPSMAEPLPNKERSNRPRTFYPGTAFLPGTRPFCCEGTTGRTVSLQQAGVPKPTRSIPRTDVAVQRPFLPSSEDGGLLAAHVERRSRCSPGGCKQDRCNGYPGYEIGCCEDFRSDAYA